jgi:hypothetical protein
MVLRSDSTNHVNHRVHFELMTKRPKPFPTKKSHRIAPVVAPMEMSYIHFDIWRARLQGVQQVTH